MAIRKVIPRSLDSAAASANLSFDANTLFVDSTNNVVGINTATPNSFATGLAVYNASNPSLAIVSGNANAYLRLYSTSDTDMYLSNVGGTMTFSTAATSRMTINSSGNVGIGTTSTTPLVASVGKYLTISNNSHATLSIQAVDGGNDRNATLELLGSGNGVSYSQIVYGDTDTTPGSPSPLIFTGYHSGTATERMRITATGNVGIGTSSPSDKLTVISAGTQVGSTNFRNIARIGLATNDASVLLGYDVSAGSAIMASTNNFPIAFWTSSAGTYAEKMRIDSNGNVGIGLTNPSVKLDVVGASAASAVMIKPQGSLPNNNDNAGLYVLHQGTGGTAFRVRTDNAVSASYFAHILVNNASAACTALQVDQYGTGNIANFTKSGTSALMVNTNGIGLGSATPASGTGIKFPTSQDASTDANTLDDYEEGTWTPTITSSSGTITSYTSTGYYVKIGKKVTVWCNVKVTNVGTGTGSVSISSMPFTVNATDLFGIVAVGRESDITGVIWQGWSTSGGNGFNVLTSANGGLIGTNYRYVGSVTYTF